eukprot:jgi/Chrzof1/5693/Cz16g12010.t1
MQSVGKCQARLPFGSSKPTLAVGAQRCLGGSHVSHVRPFRTLVCRAEGKDSGKEKGDKNEDYVEALKKGGLDQDIAKRILDKWKEVGADDPNELRKLFLKQSLLPISATALQLLFDAGAAYSIFISSVYFGVGPEFFGRTFLVYLLDFIAIYFAIGVFFDVATLGAILITTARLGTSPQSFYTAVKTIAGPSPRGGLAIADKVQTAVNAVRVAQALDAIAKILEEGTTTTSAKDSMDTLSNLSAYLTLYRSETKAGFEAASVGLEEKEVANIALVFGQYDLNDDGRLDVSETMKMLATQGLQVSQEEAKAALEVMDNNKDGYIEFDEFVKWWAERKGRVPVSSSNSRG